MQRVVAVVVRFTPVHAGAQQRLHNLRVRAKARHVERCVPESSVRRVAGDLWVETVPECEIGALLDEQVHRVEIAAARRCVRRRPTVVRHCVDLGLLLGALALAFELEDGARDLGMAAEARLHQGRPALLVARVDIGTL